MDWGWLLDWRLLFAAMGAMLVLVALSLALNETKGTTASAYSMVAAFSPPSMIINVTLLSNTEVKHYVVSIYRDGELVFSASGNTTSGLGRIMSLTVDLPIGDYLVLGYDDQCRYSFGYINSTNRNLVLRLGQGTPSSVSNLSVYINLNGTLVRPNYRVHPLVPCGSSLSGPLYVVAWYTGPRGTVMGSGVWIPGANTTLVINPTKSTGPGIYFNVINALLVGLAVGITVYLASSYILGRRV